MSLKQQIENDTKAALLGGDRFTGEVLRGLKAAILSEEVALGRREEGLSDEEVEKVIAREVKKRAESVKLYKQNDRPELADDEKKESSVLERYLPEQLSEEEIQKVVEEVIAEMGEVSIQQMGQVIGAVKAKLGTSADGAIVARITKEKLAK